MGSLMGIGAENSALDIVAILSVFKGFKQLCL